MPTRARLAFTAAAILALASCASTPPKAAIGTWGVDLTAMDQSVDPGDDFFRYVNGTWLTTFQIPPDRSRYGVFVQLDEKSETDLHAIVSELAAAESPPGSVEQKVGAFFDSWMNEEAIEARGLATLQPRLDAIAAIETRDELLAAIASPFMVSPFGMQIIPDPADTTRYTVIIGQAGLGMPDRDYYLLEDERFETFRAAYHAYLVKLQELAGIADAEDKADAVFALEHRIAEAHWSAERSREIAEIYNPMSRGELAQLAPQVDWDVILDGHGLSSVDTLVVAQTTAVAEAAKLFAEVPLETWKAYLTVHTIDSYAEFLPRVFDEASFDFHSRTLNGVPEQRERWKRGVDLINGQLGEAVGQAYVERHFPPEAKAQMDELVANLSVALDARLQVNPWMDDATRAEALKKLATFEPRIGYPVKWTDYSPLTVGDDLLGNAYAVEQFLWNLEVERLGGPVDRDLWDMSPPTVNAYYNPLMNQITFPAGILQPPFFDPAADPAVNYGAIGAVIGHEIGHGFDDQGRLFDEKGLIREWWTAESNARFTERAEKLVAQYDAFEALPGLNINGQLTLGENIGDLGGLNMAWSAWERYKTEHGEPPVIDGFTGDQRFFLAFAQIWRGAEREDFLREQVLTDPHSPVRFRVNGVVRNFDPWYEAFDVGPDDALYLPPEERVSIW
jgi:endothelin-converting enzyme/putative endopeptidase